MLSFICLQHIALVLSTLLCLTSCQTLSDSDGYTGYSLELTGRDDDTVVYKTENTDTSDGKSTSLGPPDVSLNASVSVGFIGIEVANLSAKVNIDAQVLSLLNFNAGVDVSINRVSLSIENVTAKVMLEARLENLVAMINHTLDSIDLNPILATLGNSVGNLIEDTTSVIGGSSSSSSASASSATLSARSDDESEAPYDIVHNVLYSVNSYSQNAHTNFVLSKSGEIVAESLRNNGEVYATEVVGSYWHDMTPTGQEHNVVYDGVNVIQKEYIYEPFAGLSVISAIFIDAAGNVVDTQVLSGSGGGGSSTIGNE